jgi:uncharacterized protein YegL
MGGGARSTRKKAKAEKPQKLPARRQSAAGAALASGNSKVTPDERHRMIEEAAYHRAEQRGFTDGDPLQDWLEAEAQVEIQLRDGRSSSQA